MQRGSMQLTEAAVTRPNFMKLAPLPRELRARAQATPQRDHLARDLEARR
jgi:hypothetical protein